jgi:CRISPR-associated endonuclease/helicase Cas3
MPSLGKLGGILHDLGKYSQAFQTYLRSAEGKINPDSELRGKIDHSTAGAQIIWEAMSNKEPIAKLVAQFIALCVVSHHTGLIDCLSPDGEDIFSMRINKDNNKTHSEEVWANSDKKIHNSANALINSDLCNSELKSQLGKLFRDEDSHEVREFYSGMLARFLFSTIIDADRLSAAGRADIASLNIMSDFRWNSLIERFEMYMSGLKQETEIDNTRLEISDACKDFASRETGLYRLTVPTGGGKTLSSLRFGLHHAEKHGMNRVIYVIPYTSIIDQNAAVARSILEDPNHPQIILEHHSNLTPGRETWQTQILAENWDSPIIFTTTVQLLEALFSGGTRGVRRMHNLANSVIIFDEIQTLPIRTVHIFNNAVNFLVKQCGSTIVFCTATQPLLDCVDKRKGAARFSCPSEMAPSPNELFQNFKALRHLNIVDQRKIEGWEDDEIAQCICDQAKKTFSILTIVNTKAEARSLFNLCKNEIQSIHHLSANMCSAHRMDVINLIKRKLELNISQPEPLVCISTQVIEAGVDIDFGSVIRCLAGLDSIAQAAGRCNRNGRRLSGEVFIVNPKKESLEMLPEIAVGQKVAERVLDEYQKNPDMFDNDLLSPKTIQAYYKYYFFDRAHEMSYHITSKDIGHDDNLLSLLSDNDEAVKAYKYIHNISPQLNLRQSFKSSGSVFKVIDAPTEGVIVPYGGDGKQIINTLCASTDLDVIKVLLRQAQRYAVNLYPQDKDKLTKLGGIHETQTESGIYYLDEEFYDDDLGIVINGKLQMKFQEG